MVRRKYFGLLFREIAGDCLGYRRRKSPGAGFYWEPWIGSHDFPYFFWLKSLLFTTRCLHHPTKMILIRIAKFCSPLIWNTTVKTLTKMPKRSPLTIAIAARSFDLQSPESLTVQECYDILPCNYTNSTYFFFSFLGHIKKNRWLASLAFAKKWAGGRTF